MNWHVSTLAVRASLLAAIALSTPAIVRDARAQELPRLTAPVNDLADVIDAATEAQLDTRIRALLAASGDTVVVATVRTYKPYGSIEEYATRLYERAGIGDREKDRGLLVLLAFDDRQVRIEVGYGLEEFVNDGYAGETIRRAMLPEFREGRYATGLLEGTTRLIRRIAEGRGVTIADLPAAEPEPEDDSGPTFALPLIPTLVILFVIIQIINRSGGGPSGPRRRRRGWHGGIGGFGGGFGGWSGGTGGGFGGFGGGGGGGGGFGGFGGGMSGGGGASGRW